MQLSLSPLSVFRGGRAALGRSVPRFRRAMLAAPSTIADIALADYCDGGRQSSVSYWTFVDADSQLARRAAKP